MASWNEPKEPTLKDIDPGNHTPPAWLGYMTLFGLIFWGIVIAILLIRFG